MYCLLLYRILSGRYFMPITILLFVYVSVKRVYRYLVLFGWPCLLHLLLLYTRTTCLWRFWWLTLTKIGRRNLITNVACFLCCFPRKAETMSKRVLTYILLSNGYHLLRYPRQITLFIPGRIWTNRAKC